jgi:hypothetical protein
MVNNNEVDTAQPDSKKSTKGGRHGARKRGRKGRTRAGVLRGFSARVAFPKDPIAKCLRIPQGILDQNAGNACTDREAAGYTKIGWTGAVSVEISSAIKYGLLERPSAGKVKPTELARKIVRPQQPKDRLDGLREAVLQAPVAGDFYKRYRGENLPDREFLVNSAVDSFGVPRERVDEFIDVFLQTLKDAELLEDIGEGKVLVVDATQPAEVGSLIGEEQIKKLSKGITVQSTDTCFMMMPFAEPLGGYYATVYQPAIEKAKLKAVRADAEIFGTGKILTRYGMASVARGFWWRN